MIESIKHKGLRRLAETGSAAGVSTQQVRKLRLILADLNVARTAKDMDQPGYNLHPLKGKQSGTWSVSVTGNWRVTFKINDGEVTDVDLVDYH